jgi:hypothetical protein
MAYLLGGPPYKVCFWTFSFDPFAWSSVSRQVAFPLFHCPREDNDPGRKTKFLPFLISILGLEEHIVRIF